MKKTKTIIRDIATTISKRLQAGIRAAYRRGIVQDQSKSKRQRYT